MIWFTSDTHFNHTAILRHQPARAENFRDVDEMNLAFIDGINSVVARNDVLYHMGDFSWKASRTGHFRQRLNVRTIHLCRGNHDAASTAQHVSTMEHMRFPKLGDNKFHLCHYPMATWAARQHGSYHLYGHSHGSMEDELNEYYPGRRAMDVGIDCAYKKFGQWRPFSLDEVLEQLCDVSLAGVT